MPTGSPLHTLPCAELLPRLRALTNLRVGPDDTAETGYRLTPGPFPGWRNPPPTGERSDLRLQPAVPPSRIVSATKARAPRRDRRDVDTGPSGLSRNPARRDRRCGCGIEDRFRTGSWVPPRAKGSRWWNSRFWRSVQRRPVSSMNPHWAPSRSCTTRLTAAGTYRDAGEVSASSMVFRGFLVTA